MGRRSHYEEAFISSSRSHTISYHYMGKNIHTNDVERYVLISFKSLPDDAVQMEYDVNEVSEAEIALAIGQLYSNLGVHSKIRMLEILQQYLDKETGFLEVRERAVETRH